MSKHYKQAPKALFMCPDCKVGKCETCLDKLRAVYAEKPLCSCQKKLHLSWLAMKILAWRPEIPYAYFVIFKPIEITQTLITRSLHGCMDPSLTLPSSELELV